MRLFKNRAFQVTLVDQPKKPSPTDTDISTEYQFDPQRLAETIQQTVIVSAVAIGGVVAGCTVVKAGCKIAVLTAKRVLR